MMLVWWIVGGLVVIPLLLVAVAAAGVRTRQLELARLVAVTAQRQTARVAALRPGQRRLQRQLAAVQARAAVLDQQLAHLKPDRGGSLR